MSASRLARAFPIEDPLIDVPWGATPESFLTLVNGTGVSKLTDGHYRLRCRALGGVMDAFHFHFGDGGSGRQLTRIELLRMPKHHRQREYDAMQSRLEHLLGPGEPMTPRLALYPAPSRWRVGRLTVTHEWYYQGAEYQKVLLSCPAT